MDKWTLTLTLTDPSGREHRMCIDTSAFEGREWFDVGPRGVAEFATSVDDVARPMKRREFRKDVLRAQCKLLATALGERMEDVEGWHGVDRQEKTIAADARLKASSSAQLPQ